LTNQSDERDKWTSPVAYEVRHLKPPQSFYPH
jgi:hypothetical protein